MFQFTTNRQTSLPVSVHQVSWTPAFNDREHLSQCPVDGQRNLSSLVIRRMMIKMLPVFRFSETVEPRHEKTCLREVLRRSDSNWPAQLQKLA